MHKKPQLHHLYIIMSKLYVQMIQQNTGHLHLLGCLVRSWDEFCLWWASRDSCTSSVL